MTARFHHGLFRLFSALLLCLWLSLHCALAQQQPSRPTPTPQDDVLRINTELVQTDVMVFDKSGRFVDNLQREQFELRVDGKPQTITFFDRITAGSATEEAQLAAARGAGRPEPEKGQPSVGLTDRGRVVIFFIDDLHLTADSLRRTQKILQRFIDSEMGQNDRVAIASSSGQIGFLQQLTDNKAVLRAALERLRLQPQPMKDNESPPMTEYLAMAINVRQDTGVLNYYMQPLIEQGLNPQMAEQTVKNRAQRILQQSNAVTRNTVIGLESLARTVAPLPGRKLVFFISDGFLLNMNESNIYERLWKITNTAARGAVVIYTLDARGLSTDPSFDAVNPPPFDPSGRISSATQGELTASQEALRTLAADTGGRALLNTNALDAAITKTLKETSTYYLLAWRPETEEQKNDRLRRIEVKIKGRPDLNVQFKHGFLNAAREPAAQTAADNPARSNKPKTPVDELRSAITAFAPPTALPTAMALDYMDSPETGMTLTISMQVSADALSFTQAEGKYKAAIDLGGLVYNDEGKPGASFQQHMDVTADSTDAAYQRQHPVFFTYQLRIGPGLYQVRAAARDAANGRIGTTTQWIEIPDLKSHKLTLSSLLVGEIPATASTATTDSNLVPEAQLNVARRFARTSRLRFLVFIYNAERGTTGAEPPDVAIQVQVLRADQPVMTTTLRKISTEGIQDLARLPYAAEVPLSGMPAGQYVLQITAIDRKSKSSASQQLRFSIE